MVLAHLLFVTIMIWSKSLRAFTEYDSMVFPFILYSCFGVFWSNLVLLPAASIIPVFILFVLWYTVVYFFQYFIYWFL